MRKFKSFILHALFYVYFIPTFFFVPYYNWKYAKEKGFVKWVLLGEVVATAKAFVWPYFIFFEKPKESHVSHFKKSLEYAVKSTEITNKRGDLYIKGDDSDMKLQIDFQRKALKEAEKVDIEKLNKDHPNLGNHFRDEYMKGLHLYLKGYDEKRNEDLKEGQILFDNWGIWFIANFENIRQSNGIEVKVNTNY